MKDPEKKDSTNSDLSDHYYTKAEAPKTLEVQPSTPSSNKYSYHERSPLKQSKLIPGFMGLIKAT